MGRPIRASSPTAPGDRHGALPRRATAQDRRPFRCRQRVVSRHPSADGALLSGEIDYAFDVVTSLEYVKTGKLKGLAVTVSKRLDSVPEIPTMIEAGLPGYEVATWYGFVVRSGTPPDVVATINQAFNKAIDDPEVKAKMEGLGIKLLGGTSAQFGRHIRAEMERWGGVLRKAGIKLEDGR
jgi:tripartite-type tricarboxylate transporter receptor subunit TctC